jgi:PhzF family phenazine biosynthesis protein
VFHPLATVAGALGIAASDILRASIVDVGPVWFTLQVAEAGAVIAMQPDMGKLAGLAAGVTGVTVFALYPNGSPADLEVRSFAPSQGVPENPVCGSGNGCVAAMIRRERVAPFSHYVAA